MDILEKLKTICDKVSRIEQVQARVTDQGYSITELALNNAKALCKILALCDIKEQFIYPLPLYYGDGLQFEFNGKLENIFINCKNNGEINIEMFEEEGKGDNNG